MGAELAERGVVHLAVERDVVLDLGATVDAVQDVALQVLVDGVVLLQAVQGDAVERQRAGDLLKNRKDSDSEEIKTTNLITYFHHQSRSLRRSMPSGSVPFCLFVVYL